MTDDVGFGTRARRRTGAHAHTGPARPPRPALQSVSHHGHVLAHQGGDLDRPQPPHLRHGRHHGVRHRIPRLQHGHAEELRHGGRDPQAERLQHLLFRQVPQRARLANEPGRPLRPLADRPRLRIFLRLPGRKNEPVGSGIFEGTKPIQKPCGDKTYHFDRDMADHAIAWIRQQHALAPAKPFFCYYAPGTSHAPHHAPKEWIATVPGPFRPRMGQGPRRNLRAAKAIGPGARQHGAHAAAERDPRLGFAKRGPEAALCPYDGGLSRPWPTATITSGGSSMPWSNPASSTIRSSCSFRAIMAQRRRHAARTDR